MMYMFLYFDVNVGYCGVKVGFVSVTQVTSVTSFTVKLHFDGNHLAIARCYAHPLSFNKQNSMLVK